MINLRSDMPVKVVQAMGDDLAICNAARVSVSGFEMVDGGTDFVEAGLTIRDKGLISYLMEHRHGSPFEHGAITFAIEAPIFVWREFMRHRIGFSYNEMSGRYSLLPPVFYVPPINRPLVNVGTSARPKLVPGTTEQLAATVSEHCEAYTAAYAAYSKLHDGGVAKEVARNSLPVAIYSAAYVTCNPRSIMHFLSLRTHDDEAMFVSNPQWEIEQVARQIEDHFAQRWPVTYGAWAQHGRVAP